MSDTAPRRVRGGNAPATASRTAAHSRHGRPRLRLRPDPGRRYIGANPDARLFTGPRGGRISTAVLRDATHRDDVVTKLGYAHLRRHDLRHTRLTWFADAGVPVHVLRGITGHGRSTTGPQK